MDKIDSALIRRHAAHWLRYTKQCMVLALEADLIGEPADIMGITRGRHVIEIEIKISMADFRRDIEKRKHQSMRMEAGLAYKKYRQIFFGKVIENSPQHYPVRLFYFAVPKDLGEKAAAECAELYPYAGVLGFKEDHGFAPQPYTYRVPLPLFKGKLSLENIARVIKSQSASLCRILDENKNLRERLDEKL